VTGGRNGFGAKLTNIYSEEFIVETADTKRNRRYKQVFSNNMSVKGKPQIKEGAKDSWTKITFKPDLSRFHGMSMLDNDTVSLMKKRVFDIAGSTDKSVKCYLDGTKLPIKVFKDYVELFREDKEKPLVYEKVNDRWEICVSISVGTHQQVSFVNSIATTKGGKHVDYIVDQVVDKLIATIKKKNKSIPVKPMHVKNQMSIFINCLIENPAFNSQTKECMNSQIKKFGSTCELSEKTMKSIINCGITDNILNWAKLKANAELKKNDGKKKGRINGIVKLDDANDAGGRNASQCALILTEGDSAKALAVSGLGVVGRDHYGVFPLKGKLLNVRDAAHQQIMNNDEIKNIQQIMGLQHGKTYEDTKSLRYGHIMIMADQDHDGSHIKGLVINFVSTFWPSLMKIPGFIQEFVTPIVKVTRGQTSRSFFTLSEYETWKESHNDGKGWKIKYYKGLGTSTSQEAKEYFSDLGQHKLDFVYSGDENMADLDMAFSKKKADARKDWLNSYDHDAFIDHTQETINYSDFVHKELVQFSVADNMRSIPSMVDGLKPGQRKVLFSCFKRNLKNEIKVAQLAGYVSEHSAYHHGEASLCGTIVNMAQTFCGSNNMNLLHPAGQFGTRLQGGKDAASPRYIFTQLTAMARMIFNPNDEACLDFLLDDGMSVEPQWYMPVLPMVLVNGADGIGTGWSTSVPNYNPSDIIANLRRMTSGEELEPMLPWYRGFKGTITRKVKDPKSFETVGVITVTGETTLEISELPVKKWTQDYKEFLEDNLLDNEKNKNAFIKEYKEHHTDTKVSFAVTMPSAEALEAAVKEGLEKKFKLTSSITTSNMHLFDKKGSIKKYDNPEDILASFFRLRIKMYGKRKEHLVKKLGSEWRKLDNRVRFITMILDGDLVISKKKKKALLGELKKLGFEQFTKEKKAQAAGDTAEEEVEEEEDDEEQEVATGAYDYLLGMPMWSLTHEKVEALENEASIKREELDRIEGMSLEEMYVEDLDELEETYDWWAESTAKEEAKVVKKKGGTNKGGAKKKSKAKASHIMELSDDDDIVSSEDSDFDDFEPKKKGKKAAPAKAAPARSAPKREIKKVIKPMSSDEENDDEEEAAPVKKAAAVKKKVSKPMSSDDDDSPVKVKKAAPVKAAPVVPQKPESEMTLMERLAFRASQSSAAPATASITEEASPIKAAPKAAPKRAAAKAKPVVVDSDEEDEFEFNDDSEDEAPVKKAPVAKKAKKAPVAKKVKADMSDSEDDFEMDEDAPLAAPKATARPGRAAAKAAPVNNFDFSESDDEMDSPEPKAKAKKAPAAKKEAAPKAKVEKKRAAPAKKAAAMDSDSDLDEMSVSPERESPPTKKSKDNKAKAVVTKKAPVAKKAPVMVADSPVVKIRPGRAAAKAASTKLVDKHEEFEQDSEDEAMEDAEPREPTSEPDFSASEDEDEDAESEEEEEEDSDFE